MKRETNYLKCLYLTIWSKKGWEIMMTLFSFVNFKKKMFDIQLSVSSLMFNVEEYHFESIWSLKSVWQTDTSGWSQQKMLPHGEMGRKGMKK